MNTIEEYKYRLEESELLTKNILATFPDMTWVKDVDGLYLACNPEFERFFGATESEIVGKTDHDFVDKEIADSFRKHDINAMKADRPTINEEWMTYASDGYRAFLETTKIPLRNTLGKVIGVLGIGHDTTKRHEAEISTDKYAEILKMIATGTIASKVYDEIALMYEKRHPGMRCSLLELKDGHLMHGGAPSMPKEYQDAVHGLENGPSVGSCGTSTYFGTRVIVEDIATDPKWAAIKHVALPHGMRSCWSEPIKNSSGKVLGAFGMYYDHPASPNDEESEDLTLAARLASIVMERDQAGNEIKESTTRLSLALDAGQVGVWDWNIESNVTIWDDRMFEIYGLDKIVPLPYDNWLNTVLPEDRADAEDALQRVISNKTRDISLFRIKKPDNSIRYIQTSADAVCDDSGKVIRVLGTNSDITEKKVLEQELEESYRLLHKITENIPGAIFQYRLYPDGRSIFPYASKGIEDAYEVSPEDALQDASLIFKTIHPDDLSLLEDSIKRSAETMTEFNIEYRVDLPKKGLRWLHVKSTPEKLADGSILWNGVITDITEQIADKEKLRSQAKQLQQKKQELESIIINAPNPMSLYAEGGEILMINQAWIDSSGFSLEDVPTIDAWIEHIYDDTETRTALKEYIGSLYGLTEKIDDGEFTFLNKNRDPITWQFSSAPLGVIDGKRTVISSAMDITELKRKDEMLIEQSRHAAMGEMISMIAHQWRQPLTVISMSASSMLFNIEVEDSKDEDIERASHKILHQTKELSKTIDDFRNFFKPDKEISIVDIQDILDQALSIVKDGLKNNNIDLTISFETAEDVAVNAYPRELMQVFINIINNSKDALISNNIEDPMITIRVYEHEEYISTEICDNGGGIDADILPRVFDPYFSTKGEINGTGLGLYISKMIIEDHLGGMILIDNDDDGACFTVSLLK